MRTPRVPLAALLVAAALPASANDTIRLSRFPTAEVADGRSQITVNAQVLDTSGRAAPDGTQVVFETNLGSFRESVVRTTGGLAQGILIAGGVPGTAKITATVAGGGSSPYSCDVEFVKTRAELSQSRETIEIASSGSLVYAHDKRVIEVVGPDHGATVWFHGVEVAADMLQVDLNSYTLRARKAVVKRGHRTVTYDSLFLNLTSREGYGVTNYPSTRPDSLVPYPGGVAFVESSPQGDAVAQKRMRFGIVEVGRDADQPLAKPIDSDPFGMQDISESPSTVGARTATVYARREIQFHRADIYVNNAKVLAQPNLVVQLNSGSSSPMVMDDFVSINDNQIALNYPYYTLLKPGLTSLFRLQMGERSGQALTANRGAFLNYELTWSKGDENAGGFTFGGVGRSDWLASAHQFWRMDDRTTANLQVNSPAGNAYTGSGSLNHALPGYNLSLNGSQSQTLTGFNAHTLNYGVNLERNPIKIENSSFHFAYGLTANQAQSVQPAFDRVTSKIDGSRTISQTGAGVTSRVYTDSIPLDKLSSVNGSLTAAKLFGATEYNGVKLNGSLSLTRNLGRGANMFLTYNYLQDGLNENVIGRHSLNLVGSYSTGKIDTRFNASKGIGVERMNFSAEAAYNFSGLWQLRYSHLYSQYLTDNLTDFYYVLSYRIGWRRVGLTWSNRSHRPGITLMDVNL